MQKTKQMPKLVIVAPPATPDVATVVALLRGSDLGTANRELAAAYPSTTLEERSIMLRAATKVIWEAWVASDARKQRDKLARRNRAAHTIEHDPPEDEDHAEDC